MTLKQLEYFISIARTGHISAAAKELNISQPPLSAQLRLLEDELGAELFHRDKHNLTITKAGELLYDRAIQILSLTSAAYNDVQNLGNELRGSIRIGAVTSACHRILPQRTAEFTKKHPNVDFQLWEGSSVRIMDLLSSGIIELGIIREPFNHDLYTSYPFWDDMLGENQEDPFVVVGLPKFLNFTVGKEIINPSDLSGIPLILHRRFYDILNKAFHSEGISMNVVCQNDDLISSLSWAAAGLGVALVPLTSSTLQLSEQKMTVCRIQVPMVNTKYVLIASRSSELSALAKAFIQTFGRKTEKQIRN